MLEQLQETVQRAHTQKRKKKHSLKHETYMNASTLSAFVWENSLNPEPDIEWTIIRTADPYRPGRGSCHVCASEKN